MGKNIFEDVLNIAGKGLADSLGAALPSDKWDKSFASTDSPRQQDADTADEPEEESHESSANDSADYDSDDSDDVWAAPDPASVQPLTLETLIKSALREAARETPPSPASALSKSSAARAATSAPSGADIIGGLIGLAILGGIASAIFGTKSPPVRARGRRGMPLSVGIVLIVLLVICLAVIAILAGRQ